MVSLALIIGLAACANPVADDQTTASLSPQTPAEIATSVSDSSGEFGFVLFNGNILTMEDTAPNAQAIWIKAERIAGLGSNEEVLAAAGPNAILLDLDGETVTPGFIDSHTHRITQRYKWGFDTIEKAVEEALSQGWTGLVELAVDESMLDELRDADAHGALRLRVNAYLMVDTFEGQMMDDWWSAYQPGQELSPNLRIAGLKIFIDFNSGRMLLWEQNELNEFVRERQDEGWQITMKAISIQSHELALNAYEYALNGENNDLYHYRIEHSVAANDEQVERMAYLGIIASIQPSFPGVIWYELDIRNLVSEQGVENMFRWRDYLDAGIFIVASPYNPDGVNAELTLPSHVSPMGVLYRSVTQIGLGGSQPETWMLRETLNVDQILPMLTLYGAYGTFEDETKGSLAPGKLADLVVLSEDPRTVASANLLNIQVLMTMVGGQVEWCAAGSEALCIFE